MKDDVSQQKPTLRKKKHRSTKGALIKGMSRRLPKEILESLLFEQRLREITRHYAGIYALYRRNRLYYVGLTTNLYGRLCSHLKDRHARKWNNFMFFRIQKVHYLKDIEILLQNVVEAPGNKVKGKVPTDADVNKILKEVLREHETTISGIKKALR